jgi:hypothetical protein
MKKSGVTGYVEVFYQDLDDTKDTPAIFRTFMQKWRKHYQSEGIFDIVSRHVHFMGYAKSSSLLFTYGEKHYRLLPSHLGLQDEQYFDAFKYELRQDLLSLGATEIRDTSMID